MLAQRVWKLRTTWDLRGRAVPGGREGIRTLDLSVANAALSQLSYAPPKSRRPAVDAYLQSEFDPI
jgi:hypothetical protein